MLTMGGHRIECRVDLSGLRGSLEQISRGARAAGAGLSALATTITTTLQASPELRAQLLQLASPELRP